MLSVNSSPTTVTTGATAFKGKASTKDLKNAYKQIKEFRYNTILSSNLPKDAKQNLLRNEIITELSQMNLLDKIKAIFKQINLFR